MGRKGFSYKISKLKKYDTGAIFTLIILYIDYSVWVYSRYVIFVYLETLFINQPKQVTSLVDFGLFS